MWKVMMIPSWFHCNVCYTIPSANNGDPKKRQSFALSSCGHLFCSECLNKCVSGKKCMVCGRSSFYAQSIGRNMNEKMKRFFQAPDILLADAMKRLNVIFNFRQKQNSIMQQNIKKMHGQLNSIVNEYRETAKLCDAVKRNANSLMANMQQHQGVVQQLNSSFMECSQRLEHFGNVDEDTTGNLGPVDLTHHLAQDNSTPCFLPGRMGEKGGVLSLRNEPTNSIISADELWNGSLTNLSLMSSLPKKQSAGIVNSDQTSPSVSFYQPTIASSSPGNLSAAFDARNWNNALQPKPINSGNQYLQLISTRNAHSPAGQFSRSLPSLRKGALLSQENPSVNKRRPSLSQNVQLSRNILELESSTGEMFGLRGHGQSLIRSPPRKTHRSGDI